MLVLLKLYWAPDIVKFVLGRFSHFNIAIAYSNSTFCSAWTPSFCEFTQIFSKTSTPLISERRIKELEILKNANQRFGENENEHIDLQYKEIDHLLVNVYNELKEFHEKFKNRQDKKLDEELGKLNKIAKQRRRMQTAAERLLGQQPSSDFLAQAEQFHSKKQLKDLPEETEDLERLQYKYPICSQLMTNNREIKAFLRQHLIGSFVSTDKTGAYVIKQNALRRKRSNQSLCSVGASSAGESFIRRSSFREENSYFPTISEYAESLCEDPAPVAPIYDMIFADILTYTDVKQLNRLHVKSFSSTLFEGNSMWICSWTKNILGTMYAVFLNVDRTTFEVQLKKKKKLRTAGCPTIMFMTEESIVFAKKNGSEIYQFKMSAQKFKQIFRRADLTIAAMCGNEDYVYIIDKKTRKYIQVLDSEQNPECKIRTGLDHAHEYDIDICLTTATTAATNHSVVLCTTCPPSVRLLSEHSIIWQLDCHTFLQLDHQFSPCSVTASAVGEVFFADQGTDTVGSTSVTLLVWYKSNS